MKAFEQWDYPQDEKAEYPLEEDLSRLAPPDETRGSRKSWRLMRRLFLPAVDQPEQPEEVRRTFRVQGELERLHPEIEPLPPTPITPEAKERLTSWGVSEEDIEHISDITSSLRYDLPLPRAQRIAENGAYIHENFTGTYVIVPDVFDVTGRLDGQCGELSLHLLRLLHGSGVIDDINRKLRRQKKTPLTAYRVEGKSRTHFITPKSTHLWLGLAPEDAERAKMVTLDGSFQEISTLEENGYHVTEEKFTPRDYIHATSLIVPTDSYDGVFFFGSGRNAIVLGLSTDKKYIYRLGFVEDTQTETIRPYINCLDTSGEVGAICMPGDDGDTHWIEDIPDNAEVTEELNRIIDGVSTMSLTRDPEKEQAALAKRITIPIITS